ncbi:MAG: 16S rRNA (uracil(1498)-N(3))-methyltransferase [Woeseiaceae bacterium]|jgi:16S rRNA (uracil1498-N3)-methyltransferase|nr:16S rRNA (uracil(1498)-N(3))-methyltransferase [Woeseiaceae bacterium]MDG1864790.1 16S rRNA (uracil(1498)-N(3))-methyltransferase [Woeseiaceae bacterium]
MQKHRLYIDHSITPNKIICLTDSKAHYCIQVLRLKENNIITIFNGDGYEYSAVIVEITKRTITIIPSNHSFKEIPFLRKINIGQSLIRKEKMDMIIQKITELGINEITPIISKYTTVKLLENRLLKKLEHWKKISQSACEQCERNILPIINTPITMQKFIINSSKKNCRLIIDPRATTTINNINPGHRNIDIIIGPEGGFSEDELQSAIKLDYQPVSLGPRILRSETAAITSIAILQSKWGDVGADLVSRKR